MLQQLAEKLIEEVQISQGVKKPRRIEVTYIESVDKLRVAPMDYREGYDLYIVGQYIGTEAPF